jgi:hypothetical protein
VLADTDRSARRAAGSTAAKQESHEGSCCSFVPPPCGPVSTQKKTVRETVRSWRLDDATARARALAVHESGVQARDVVVIKSNRVNANLAADAEA